MAPDQHLESQYILGLKTKARRIAIFKAGTKITLNFTFLFDQSNLSEDKEIAPMLKCNIKDPI